MRITKNWWSEMSVTILSDVIASLIPFKKMFLINVIDLGVMQVERVTEGTKLFEYILQDILL